MVKLYVADIKCLDSAQTFEEYLYKVNEQRRAKVLRCKNEEDRKRTLLAGWLLSYGLEKEGFCYKELEFLVTPEGKPYLSAEPSVFFSLSHAGNYALCAISNHSLGVDVESKHRKLFVDEHAETLMAVARRSFSKQEYQEFLELSEDVQVEYFLKLWTRKEALGKAMGKGLAMDFSKICEPEEKFLSFWLNEEYYISIYSEADVIGKEDVEICMMN